MRDSLEVKLVFDVTRLGVFSAEKFAARRQIVEQRTHFYLRSGRFAASPARAAPPAADHDFGARDRIVLARRELETRDARDARQRFTAKAKRRDRDKIVGISNLARGVSL